MSFSELSQAQLSKTVDLMRQYGGGFVSSLADCICEADLGNRIRLMQAFPHIFEEYGPTGIFWKHILVETPENSSETPLEVGFGDNEVPF